MDRAVSLLQRVRTASGFASFPLLFVEECARKVAVQVAQGVSLRKAGDRLLFVDSDVLSDYDCSLLQLLGAYLSATVSVHPFRQDPIWFDHLLSDQFQERIRLKNKDAAIFLGVRSLINHKGDLHSSAGDQGRMQEVVGGLNNLRTIARRDETQDSPDFTLDHLIEDCRGRVGELIASEKQVQDVSGRVNDVRLTYLTAIWFLLYSRGIRADSLWNSVRWVEMRETRGFPAGACTFKAYGDIYRYARRLWLEKSGLKSIYSCARKPVLYSDEALSIGKEEYTIVEPAFRTLGAQYLLEQMGWFLSNGGLIYYLIPRNLGELDSSRWVLNGEIPSGLVICRRDARSVLPCVLGEDFGVYSLWNGPKGIEAPYSSRRASKEFLDSFRGVMSEYFEKQSIGDILLAGESEARM